MARGQPTSLLQAQNGQGPGPGLLAAEELLDRRHLPGIGVHHPGVEGLALAHGRSGSDDDQRAGLEAVEPFVEVHVAGWHTGDALAPVEQLLQPVHGGVQEFGQRLQAVGHPPLRHVEHQALGPVHGGGHVVGDAVAHFGDFARHRYHPAQEGVLLHDPGVSARIRGGRRVGLQRHEGGQATRRVEQPGPAQFVAHRHRVGRLTLVVQDVDGLEDVGMGRLVEVLRPACLHGRGDGVARQEHGPEQGLLGIQVVGRDP